MAKASAARVAALGVLGDARRREGRVRDMLRASERVEGLDARDRSLATRLTLGVVGARGLLDALIDAHLTGRAHLEPKVRDALRLSVFELLFLSTPSQVAASQGVELVKRAQPRAQGLANAVLRRVVEQDVPLRAEAVERVRRGSCATDELALLSGYPSWLLDRVASERGAHAARDMALSALEPAPVYVAGNLARHDDAATEELLARAGLAPVRTDLSGSFVLESPAGLASSGLVESTDVVVADLAAQRVALCAQARPGMAVLEVGQGRGTKSLLLQDAALRAGGRARIVGVDSERFKVRVARGRMERAGLADSVTCLELDARTLDVRDVPTGLNTTFDLVFVDAPCSGTGTLRRHPEIAWTLGAGDVGTLARLQGQILAASASRVRPGGTLLYATCSVLRAENEGVVGAFLSTERGEAFEPVGEPMQTLPARRGPDGHFCVRLRRR